METYTKHILCAIHLHNGLTVFDTHKDANFIMLYQHVIQEPLILPPLKQHSLLTLLIKWASKAVTIHNLET